MCNIYVHIYTVLRKTGTFVVLAYISVSFCSVLMKFSGLLVVEVFLHKIGICNGPGSNISQIIQYFTQLLQIESEQNNLL